MKQKVIFIMINVHRFSLSNKDMTLKNRREYFFKNISFCYEGCNFKGIDNLTNFIICECNGTILKKKNLNFDNIIYYNQSVNFPTKFTKFK